MEIGSVLFPPNLSGSFWRGVLLFSFLQTVGFFCWMYIGSQFKKMILASSAGGWIFFSVALLYGFVALVITGLSQYTYDRFFVGVLVVTFVAGIWFSSLASAALAGKLGKMRIVRDSSSVLRLKARRGGFVLRRLALVWGACWLLGLLGPVAGMVYGEMGWRKTIYYVGAVVVGAVALGFLLRWVFQARRVITCEAATRRLTIVEKGQAPRTVPCAEVAKVTLDRREGEDKVFVVAVDLVLTDGEIIPIDSGTNGPYLVKIAQRLCALGELAFDDLQDGLEDHA